MTINKSVILTLKEKQTLFKLWNSEYPDKIIYSELSEFENYLNELSDQEHYFLLNDKNEILGWAFTFMRNEENWFAIIVSSKIHRKGFGTILLDELKKNNAVLNGWAVDHQNEIKKNKEKYISPIVFYVKNGFFVNQKIRIENNKISAVKIIWKKNRDKYNSDII